jgi:hypothetical protein
MISLVTMLEDKNEVMRFYGIVPVQKKVRARETDGRNCAIQVQDLPAGRLHRVRKLK